MQFTVSFDSRGIAKMLEHISNIFYDPYISKDVIEKNLEKTVAEFE